MSHSPTTDLSFEQALAALEEIVRDLEDGQTSLEDALSRYEAGVKLLKSCYRQLNQAEQRIVQLTGVDEEGTPLLQPFEHSATAEPEPAEPRKRRKKSAGSDELFQ
jgi:exodeoxyribonuclease VII small subunit